MNDIRDLIATLEWIIQRLEIEAEKELEGKKPNYKKAATECVEEAYGCLSRVDKT